MARSRAGGPSLGGKQETEASPLLSGCLLPASLRAVLLWESNRHKRRDSWTGHSRRLEIAAVARASGEPFPQLLTGRSVLCAGQRQRPMSPAPRGTRRLPATQVRGFWTTIQHRVPTEQTNKT